VCGNSQRGAEGAFSCGGVAKPTEYAMTTTSHDIAAELAQIVRFASTHIKLEITGGTRTWRL